MSHAYKITGMGKFKNAAGVDIPLIRIRNPWGKETYNSRYSDASDLWDETLKANVNAAAEQEYERHRGVQNDGNFYVDEQVF